MKRILPVIIAFAFQNSDELRAQIPFNTMDSVHINKINASVLVHGDMWWNPVTQQAHAHYPANAATNINFVSSLWMSGYDAGNNLHVSAQTYRISGNDYWPGPLNSSDTLTYATASDWAKIWKINRTDIQHFQSITTHTTANTPEPILRWPGKGNTYAQGNAGVPLTITDNMAPFVDLNSNGNYEPLLGEYPDVRGDQALWWVFSDNGPAHAQTNGKPLGVEVHGMAYAYKRGTLIDNVVYYDYTVINKSPNSYHDVRLSLFDDVDMGYFLDDYIGFDSAWRMGICYNANSDDGIAAGHPANAYGTAVPVMGVTLIVLPGDAGTSYVPAGSFVYHNNDNSIIGNPTVDSQYSNYMRAKIRNGQHFTNSFVGAGTPCNGYSSGPNSNYVYTGNPSVNTEWSECACNNNPGDRRFILSSADFNLAAGSSQHMVMAMVVTDTGEGGCGKPLSFNNIKIVADTAWKNYYYPPAPLPPSGVHDVEKTRALHIYPNPAKDKLFIEHTGNYGNEGTIQVFNSIGQLIPLHIIDTGKLHEADISLLPGGLYNVLYMQDGLHSTAKFIKE